ncbi:MAG TPA: hypothetical protein PLV10_07020 [Candidatus Latescibacteria bacterium]|nr:hypothetical protein [Candidatus Latescibacterota bacterium]HQK22802.1 hypothetical protein [Candidatus Latescibacterota bacterium]
MTAGSGSGPSFQQHERLDVHIGESRDNLPLLERWSVRVPTRFPADGWGGWFSFAQTPPCARNLFPVILTFS